MKDIIIQLLTGMLGSLGFALLFGLKKKYLLNAALGGLICCALYQVGMLIFGSIFLACLAASAFCALYSEVAARLKKAPSTLFFITSVIPLVPGGSLYYACSNAVIRDWEKAKYFSMLTLQYALAIAAGACVVWAIMITVENIKKNKQTSSENL